MELRISWKKGAQTIARFTLYGPDSSKGVVDIYGPKGQEAFRLDRTSSGRKLSKDAWHEVRFAVVPGKTVEVTIDGQSIGTLKIKALSRVGFNAGGHGFYLDDFEMFYQE